MGRSPATPSCAPNIGFVEIVDVGGEQMTGIVRNVVTAAQREMAVSQGDN